MTVTVDATTSGKTLRITGAMSDLRRIEEVTETWANWTERVLNLPASRMAYYALQEAIPEDRLDYTDVAKIVIQRFLDLAQQEDKARALLLAEAITIDDYQFGGLFPKPWEHQIRMFGLAKGKDAFGYFAEMGTGKSRVIIDEAAYLFENDKIDMCLVIAWPSGVPLQWVEQAIPDHMPDRIKYRVWSRRPGKKLPDDLFTHVPGVLRFYAMNVEQLSITSGVALVEKLLASVKDKRVLLVFDESSTLKHPHSKRAKVAMKVAMKASFRRIMTGTPITQGMHDLYSQMRLLNPDIIGATSFTAFRNRYCRMGGFEERQIVGYKNVEDLMSKVQAHTFRIRKAECLDLPPKNFIQREIEFHSDQKKLYDAMKKDYFVRLRNGEFLSGEMGATRILRLQQIVSGHLPIIETLPNGAIKTIGWDPIKNNRIQEVEHILSGIDGKTIIFCKFSADIAQLIEKLGECAVEYSGKVGSAGKERALYLFKQAPETRVMVAQLRAGSHGLDLNFASNMIYFSRDWSYEVDVQSQDRIHRGGQTKSCSYFYIKIPKTVDDMIDDVIRRKLNMAKMCLDHDYISKFI